MFGTALLASHNKTAGELWKETANRDKYIQMWHKEVGRFAEPCRIKPRRLTIRKQVWEKHGVDVILAPVSAAPALPHG